MHVTEHKMGLKINLITITFLLKEINKRINVHYDELIDTMSEVEPIDYSTPPNPKTIKRSAPFGFIGSISKTLFGTLSDSDGQKYNQQIKELFKGLINLAKISNEEAHLVEHQLAHMSKKINDTNETVNKAMKAVASTIKKWNNVDTSVWHHMFNIQAITFTTNSVETALMHYLDVFKTLTDAVRAARSGHFHPSLVSTPRLQQIIRQISDLRRSYEFPIRIQHVRPDKLSEVASVQLGFKGNTFLIEIRIPLLNKFPTELYRVHSISITQHHEQHVVIAYIKSQTPYMTMTNDK